MPKPKVLGAAVLHHGDCLEILPTLSNIDAIVTDPPYHLTSIVARFVGKNAKPAQFGSDGAYARASRGFMGKEWDGGDIAFRPETWNLVLNALKPGAHMAVFGGSRGYHRMACAIEDAGFEIRDSLMWLYGTGFPKSHNLDGEWNGWGSALKPAFEPIVLARKPLVGTIAANVLQYGTGAINIDACRIPASDKTPAPVGTFSRPSIGTTGHSGVRNGSADGLGRWPANVLHDGSDEVEAAFAAFGEKKSSAVRSEVGTRPAGFGNVGWEKGSSIPCASGFGDTGTASRFFYCAKASKADRADSKHPTVKPLALIRWLCRLITPPGGVVLDPFSGTGTTISAALECGFKTIGIEREEEYFADMMQRVKTTNKCLQFA